MANDGKFLGARKTSLIEASRKALKTKQEYDRLAKGIADLENTIGSAKNQLAGMQKNAAEMDSRATTLVGKAKAAIEGQLLALRRAIAIQDKTVAEKSRKLTKDKQELAKKEKELTKKQQTVIDKEEEVAKAEKALNADKAKEREDFEEYNDHLRDMVAALDGIDEDIAEKLVKKQEDPDKKRKSELKDVNKQIKDLNKGFIGRWASDKIDNLRVVKAFKWVNQRLEDRKEKKERLAELHVRKQQIEATGKLRVAIEKELQQREKDEKERRRQEKSGSAEYVESLKRGGVKAVAEAYANTAAQKAVDIVSHTPSSGTSPLAGVKKSSTSYTTQDTAAETQLNRSVLEREVDALEKIAKAAESCMSAKGKDGKEGGKGGMGVADWKAAWDIGKKLLPLLGRVAVGAAAVAAAGYGAYRAYGEVKKLWTGEDENGKKLDDFDKAKSVANLAVQGSLTTLGFLLGGPQGAAFAAGLSPLLMDAVGTFGNMLAESSIGPIIGRGIALVLNPLEELPKLWKDQAKFLEECVGKVAAMAASFIKPAKEALAGARDKVVAAGGAAIESTVNAAKSVGATAASAWNKVKSTVTGTAAEAPGTVKRAAESAGKVAVQAAAPVAAAASSVGSTIGAGASAAVETVKSGYKSISEAAGKLFRYNKPGVDMEGLQPAVKQNFLGMAQDYKDATGKLIPINSGFRSRQAQEAEYAADPNKAAKPGTSPHEKGIAIDTNTEHGNRLDSLGLLAKWGFSRPAKTKKGEPETWHLQVAGTAKKAAALGINNGDYQEKPTTAVVSKTTEANAAPETATPTKPTTKVATEQAAPQPQASASQKQGGGAMQVAGGAGGPANNSPKMSAESIPMFSYADPTFFALNLSALA